MSRTALVLLALLVCALACWLALGGVERGAPALAVVEAETPAAPREPTLSAPPELVPPTADESVADGAAQRTAAPDDRPRIAGHVRVAGGIPAGEAAHVLAEVYVGRENASRPQYVHADVARDGSFELRVPRGARYAMLDVEGELLHLAEPVKALPGDERVVLEPELLALVRGRVLAPLGVAAQGMDDVRLSCGPKAADAERDERFVSPYMGADASGTLEIRPALDGAFAFTCLPVGVELELAAQSPWGPGWHERLEPLAPGEHRELVIALEAGITLAGRVLDELDAPVPGASVTAMESMDNGPGWRGSPDTKTDEDGRFEFRGLARQDWRVAVTGPSFANNTEVLVDGTAGDARELVLRAVRGGCIEGTVEWPDGRPAERFSLIASAPEAFKHGWFTGGRFEQCALGDEPYELEVSAEADGLKGHAHVQAVHAGERGLRIVLEAQPVFEVHGTVVDSAEEPVPTFRIQVSDGRSSNSEGHEAGSFVLKLPAGEWRIEAQADERLAVQQTVVVGAHTAPLRFVLSAAGRVRGTVLDARGQPVADAAVGRVGSGRLAKERTDASGRFELAATSAPVRLQAVCDGHAASEVLELDVAAGALVEGVVLHLREACRLEGRVLDADGRPVSGVHLIARAEEAFEDAESNARGEFVFEGLAPGRVDVTAMRDEGLSASATAVLEGGRTTTVELRFERPDPVRLRGRIVRGGKPFAGQLWLQTKARTAHAGATSGVDGRFETTLARPGEWQCWVWLGVAGAPPDPADVRVLDFVVPDVDEHELALDVDAMEGMDGFDELGY